MRSRIFGGYTHARITDRDLYATFGGLFAAGWQRLPGDRDLPFVGRELDGVGHQVIEDLVQECSGRL